jgi:formate/nitrite transporter FocA (FNT family)
MYRLVIKDLAMSWRQLTIVAAILPGYLILWAFQRGIQTSFIYGCFLVAWAPFLIIVREELFRGHIIYVSLPLNRKKIVCARYWTIWTMAIMTLMFVCITLLILAQIFPTLAAGITVPFTAGGVIIGLSVVMVLHALNLPLIMWRGTFAGSMIFAVGLVVLVYLTKQLSYVLSFVLNAIGALESIVFVSRELMSKTGEPMFYGFVLLVTVFLNWISYRCSVALYKTRDF